MRNKKFLWIAIGIFVVIGLFLFSIGRFFGNSTNQSVANLPTYRLPATEESQISALVENFVNLYNSYSLNNYENIYSIAVFMTPDMYDKVPAYTQSLQTSLRNGEVVTAEAGAETFSYTQSVADQVETKIDFKLISAFGQTINSKSMQAIIVLKQDEVNKNWLVDKISINKK